MNYFFNFFKCFFFNFNGFALFYRLIQPIFCRSTWKMKKKYWELTQLCCKSFEFMLLEVFFWPKFLMAIFCFPLNERLPTYCRLRGRPSVFFSIVFWLTSVSFYLRCFNGLQYIDCVWAPNWYKSWLCVFQKLEGSNAKAIDSFLKHSGLDFQNIL